jgi:hypothetical protein
VVKSEETIAIEVGRKLRELVAAAGDEAPEAYLVRLNPKVTHVFTGTYAVTSASMIIVTIVRPVVPDSRRSGG